ncbi:MAG TPA: ABC transporter ATP-binding protein [Gemmatimonadaceae bacterium]|nr:ABC transporter ATP-binding protein [Gemmatimonadaceae bacterium]
MRASAPHDDLVRVDALTKRFVARRSFVDSIAHPLDRRYVEVLRGVSLHVRRGEFFGLLGPNGAGKTTLFKILSTLVLPDGGTARVAGADVAREPHAVRRVLTPVIADERSLYWRLTGLENLRLFAALYGLSAADARQRADALIDTVGLASARDRMVATYSSGMKQRLLIARALLSRPAVLLLDEPTRSLDPVSARDFRRFLRDEIVERQGCTVLLATHDADEAFELCDRLAVLDRGRVVATGTTRELSELAGSRRYRAVVAAGDGENARATLDACGWFAAASIAGDESSWASIDGSVGAHVDGADVVRRLVSDGVRVAEFSRLPLSLADLVERLVERGRVA